MGVGVLPVVGTVQSVVEVVTGRDYIEGTEVNRWLAGAGIVAGIAPGGKALLKGGTKAVGRFFWGNERTLARHFRDHGADFGARNADEYANLAADALRTSQAERWPTKIDSDGVIRIYDPTTNTFGAFNPDGTTRTLFKPGFYPDTTDGLEKPCKSI
jgi:hypothetical protein